MVEFDVNEMVKRFLAWQLPDDVSSDLCVSDANYPFIRTGTSLLTAEQAKKMFLHCVRPGCFGWEECGSRAMRGCPWATPCGDAAHAPAEQAKG